MNDTTTITTTDDFPRAINVDALHNQPSTSSNIEESNRGFVTQWVNFSAKIYDYPDISRSRSLEILRDVKDLTNNMMTETVNTFADSTCAQDHERSLTEIKTIFENYSNSISAFDSEYSIY